MVKNGWYYHKCGQKIFKVLPETVLLNHVTYCKRCKTEQKVSIYCGKEIEVKEIKNETQKSFKKNYSRLACTYDGYVNCHTCNGGGL